MAVRSTLPSHPPAKIRELLRGLPAATGYTVTVKERGVVKTAPQVVARSASGGAGYARETEDGLAWSFAILPEGDGVVVHATPRGFRNGSEQHGDIWVAEDLRFPAEVFTLPGPVEFWALPINLKGHTGSFCRPVLVVR